VPDRGHADRSLDQDQQQRVDDVDLARPDQQVGQNTMTTIGMGIAKP
jgi:hypothetical protein